MQAKPRRRSRYQRTRSLPFVVALRIFINRAAGQPLPCSRDVTSLRDAWLRGHPLSKALRDLSGLPIHQIGATASQSRAIAQGPSPRSHPSSHHRSHPDAHPRNIARPSTSDARLSGASVESVDLRERRRERRSGMPPGRCARSMPRARDDTGTAELYLTRPP